MVTPKSLSTACIHHGVYGFYIHQLLHPHPAAVDNQLLRAVSGWCCVEGSVRDRMDVYMCVSLQYIRPSAPAGMLQRVGAGEENGRAMLEPRNPTPAPPSSARRPDPSLPPLSLTVTANTYPSLHVSNTFTSARNMPAVGGRAA